MTDQQVAVRGRGRPGHEVAAAALRCLRPRFVPDLLDRQREERERDRPRPPRRSRRARRCSQGKPRFGERAVLRRPARAASSQVRPAGRSSRRDSISAWIRSRAPLAHLRGPPRGGCRRRGRSRWDQASWGRRDGRCRRRSRSRRAVGRRGLRAPSRWSLPALNAATASAPKPQIVAATNRNPPSTGHERHHAQDDPAQQEGERGRARRLQQQPPEG